MAEEYEPGGNGQSSAGGGLKIGGVKIPRWALYVGAGGIVLMLLLARRGSSGEVEESDTSTGLLATEFDQRLREQWEAWQEWLDEWLATHDTSPVEPPTEYEECPAGYFRDANGNCQSIDGSGNGDGETFLDPNVDGDSDIGYLGPPDEEEEDGCPAGYELDPSGLQCIPKGSQGPQSDPLLEFASEMEKGSLSNMFRLEAE